MHTVNGVNLVLNAFEQVAANTHKPAEALGTLAMGRKTNKTSAITTSVSPFYANTFFDDKFYVHIHGK